MDTKNYYSYIERFSAITTEIEHHPLLELLEFRLNPPVSKNVIADVENKIGHALPAPMRDFYSQSNGLKLRWRILPDLPRRAVQKISEKFDDYSIELPENEDIPFAQINIVSLEDCFLNLNWEGFEFGEPEKTIDYGGVVYLHDEFARRLKPFDLFSTYQCMAIVLEPDIINLKVILLSDHYIQWHFSRITDFASYLEMLIVTRGIVASRDRFYREYRGDLKPPLITGESDWKTDYIPKLFQMINAE